MGRPTQITDHPNFIMLKLLWFLVIITCLLDLVQGKQYTLFQYMILFIILLLPTLLLKGETFLTRGSYLLVMVLILYFSLRLFWLPSLINLLFLYLAMFLTILFQSPTLILMAGTAATAVSIIVFQLHPGSLVSAAEAMQPVWFIIPGLILISLMLVVNRFIQVAQQQTLREQQQWHNIQKGFAILRWSFEIKTKRLFLSQGAEELTGLPAELFVKQPKEIQKLVHPYDSLRLFEAYKDLLAGKKKVIEHRLLLNDGSIRWVHNFALPCKDQTGQVVRVDGLIIDVSEQKSREEKIKHMAFYDQLTGLPNRIMFENYFAFTLAGEKHREQKLALIFIDLDQFKQVNDEMGHDVGDLLLKEVAMRIKTIMRESDLFARLGGDEFVALLTSVSRETITMVAERIIEAFSCSFMIGEYELHVGASIGISVYPEDGRDLETLIKNADEAMYTAKRKGKNQYYFYVN
jgi:diguanylate cyclase (GGDEF)-like protein/PAS domain S-box-containing protein